MAVGRQHLPHHAEADALPAALGVAGPGDAVYQLVHYDADYHQSKHDAPMPGASQQVSYRLAATPNHEERHQKHDGRYQHDSQGKEIGLSDVDGHLAPYFVVFFH